MQKSQEISTFDMAKIEKAIEDFCKEQANLREDLQKIHMEWAKLAANYLDSILKIEEKK